MVVTGDLGQVDLPRGVTSGLRQASEILDGVEGIGIVRLAPLDVIRHDVVTRVVEAYGAYEARQKALRQQERSLRRRQREATAESEEEA